MRGRLALFLALGCGALGTGFAAADDAAAAKPPMVTRWAEQVDRAAPLPDYPRPQLQRANWINLNGPWDYAIRPRAQAERPERFDGQIVVPFAVESHLSGVKRRVGEGERLWYRRTFDAPALSGGQRLLLHFGAVDWQADVSLNGRPLGRHEGGYDPFTFDVTEYLSPGQPQELVVAVWDPTERGAQPRGKQTSRPGGVWYTPVTGIWQTVWLEVVPAASILSLQLTPNLDAGTVGVRFNLHRGRRGEAQVRVLAGDQVVAKTDWTPVQCALGDTTQPIVATVPQPRAWSPADPFLYDVEITLRSGESEDRVRSYFGFRHVEVRRAADGHHRIVLNHEPLFSFGPLDQGWWPDGLYTAPTDEALRWDIEMIRQLGFNSVRKHVKIEPARWYYHCDRLGLLVWQDMPSGMIASVPSQIPPEAAVDGIMPAEVAAQFRRELLAMIEALRPFTSVIVWVPFNEGWGQHATNATLAWVKQLDPTRIVGGPSGWNDLGFGDLYDRHYYEAPVMWPPYPGRANVLGEFGALKHAVKGHLWWEDPKRPAPAETAEEFEERYRRLLTPLASFVDDGLAAAIYTQLTDVEGEINGLITYDRAVVKIAPEKLAELHRLRATRAARGSH